MPGTQELLIIFAAVLLLFGAKKLPEFGRALGDTLRELRSVGKEIDEEVKK